MQARNRSRVPCSLSRAGKGGVCAPKRSCVRMTTAGLCMHPTCGSLLHTRRPPAEVGTSAPAEISAPVDTRASLTATVSAPPSTTRSGAAPAPSPTPSPTPSTSCCTRAAAVTACHLSLLADVRPRRDVSDFTARLSQHAPSAVSVSPVHSASLAHRSQHSGKDCTISAFEVRSPPVKSVLRSTAKSAQPGAAPPASFSAGAMRCPIAAECHVDGRDSFEADADGRSISVIGALRADMTGARCMCAGMATHTPMRVHMSMRIHTHMQRYWFTHARMRARTHTLTRTRADTCPAIARA
eukprot:4326083-Pleurochrysis_carterae.AAC.1